MKNYAFIDMHIHTAHSQEELCEVTVEEVFEMAQKRAEKSALDCVISITDHNTMTACFEAQELVKSGKYNKVKFINGIEFTTDISEIDEIIGERMFERCHILAYNFDETNSELLAYSKVTHIDFNMEENVGLQICSARRALNEKYNISIPFTELLPLINLTPESDIRDEFINCIKPFLHDHDVEVEDNELNKFLTPYICENVGVNQKAKTYGRLKLSEVAKLINDAHGELTLAHPASIKLNKAIIAEHFNTVVLPGPTNMLNLLNYKNSYEILDLFFSTASKIDGVKFSGIEKYSPATIFGRVDKSAQKIMDKYGLYATAGSDYHGYILTKDKEIGEVFCNRLEDLYYKNNRKQRILTVNALPCLDHLIDREEYKPQEPILKGGGFVVNQIDLEMFITIADKKQSQEMLNLMAGKMQRVAESVEHKLAKANKKANQPKNTTSPKVEVQNFKSRIDDLITIPDKINDLLIARDTTPAKRIGILLRINTFATKVYEGLMISVSAGKISKKDVENEIKKIKEVVQKIKNNYDKVCQSYPKAIKSYKASIVSNNSSKGDCLDKFAKLDIDKYIM